MARTYRYRVVDVFTDKPLEGNPLAVFLDAVELDGATMQKIAREMNLSETTFILPPADARCAAFVRIFTPVNEMRFAGHPTIGTAYVMMAEGIVAKDASDFLLEEKVGPVAVRVEGRDHPMIWLTTPPIADGATYDRDRCAGALGLATSDLLDVPPQILSAGNPTLFVAVRDKQTVDRASLDGTGMREVRPATGDPLCVFVFTPTPEGAYSRMFAPDHGVPEDPATGSSTGPLAAYMIRHKLVGAAAGSHFFSEQGTKMGRRSILHVHVRGESGANGIEVGGHVAPVAEGVIVL